MAETFILDGYNIIYKVPMFRMRLNESLSAARTALAMHMSSWKRAYPSSRVIIVFDGRDSHFPHTPRTLLHGVDCYFTSSNMDADDKIIELLRESQNTLKVTVISEDNKVANHCRAFGAKNVSASFLNVKGSVSKPPTAKSKKEDIPQNKYDEITKWYEEKLKTRPL